MLPMVLESYKFDSVFLNTLDKAFRQENLKSTKGENFIFLMSPAKTKINL